MANCQHFPNRKLGDEVDDILALLLDIKPTWVKNDVQIKSLSGGYSSNIFRCFSQSTPDDAVTVRVRRLLTKDRAPHADPEFEVKTLLELSRLGVFAPLLATFSNGYCYEYLKGQPIDHFNVPVTLLRLIARSLANAHLSVVPGADFTRTPYFSNLAALAGNDKLPWRDEWPSREELVQEVDVIQDYVASVKSPFVLCHGDVHCGNIVWDKEKDRVTLVDWELAYVGHRACDIAYFLYIFEYLAYMRNIPHVPAKDLNRLFCQYYLERCNELRSKDESKEEVSDEEIKQLLFEVTHFKLVVIFQWLIYVFAFWETTEKLGPDTASLVHYNVNRYLDVKEEAFGFRRFGR